MDNKTKSLKVQKFRINNKLTHKQAADFLGIPLNTFKSYCGGRRVVPDDVLKHIELYWEFRAVLLAVDRKYAFDYQPFIKKYLNLANSQDI